MTRNLRLALDVVTAEFWRFRFVSVRTLAKRIQLCGRQHHTTGRLPDVRELVDEPALIPQRSSAEIMRRTPF